MWWKKATREESTITSVTPHDLNSEPIGTVASNGSLSLIRAFMELPRREYIKQRWITHKDGSNTQDDITYFLSSMAIVSALLGGSTLAMLMSVGDLAFSDRYKEAAYVTVAGIATLFAFMNVLLCTRLLIHVQILRKHEILTFIESAASQLLVPLKYYAIYVWALPLAVLIFLIDRYGWLYPDVAGVVAFVINIHPMAQSAHTIQIMHSLPPANVEVNST